jgi:NAD(P)-dependent dehydrogenase (short-subunit alcohol dehydrogenase family)
MIPLDNSVVVVIGGSSGVGEAVARAALGRGASVVIGGRSPEGLESAKSRLGGDVRALTVDIKQRETIERFFEQIGPLDHLVITAGEEIEGTIRDIDPDSLRPTVESRFWGPLYAVKAALPGLSETGSVTLTSGASATVRTGAPLWHALLGTVESLTRILASELGPIRVNAVRPGHLATPRTERRRGGKEGAAKYLEELARRSPIGRVGSADDVADAILFLMTSAYTTGMMLAIDGGFTFLPPKAAPG